MMTILYIATEITNSGGVNRTLSNKANYLTDTMKFQVHILSTNDETSTPFFDFSSQITFHFLPTKINSFPSFRRFKKDIQSSVTKINPDCVIITDNGIKGLFVRKWVPKNIPCIYELHADVDYFINHSYKGIKKHINRYFIKKNLPSFDKIILLKDDNLPDFVPKENQLIIPNPLPLQSSKHSQLNHRRAIAVGRIVALKGYHRMLKVWKEIILKYPDYMLDIYGASSDELDLTETIKALGLEKNVIIHPPVKNIQNKYLQADFLLHASYFEAFPMVFLEAMSCGLPIVCYSLTSLKLLIHNNNSLIGSTEKELVNYIFSLIENKNLQTKLAEGAINKANEYHINKIMPQWISLFENLTDNTLLTKKASKK